MDRDNTIDLVSQAARAVGLRRPLVTTRDGRSVLLVHEEPQWDQFLSILGTSFGTTLHIGVGGPCRLSAIARSLDEAVFALKVGTRPDGGHPVPGSRRWGSGGSWSTPTRRPSSANSCTSGSAALIEHDRLHNSELVKTLTTYLKELCTTDATRTPARPSQHAPLSPVQDRTHHRPRPGGSGPALPTRVRLPGVAGAAGARGELTPGRVASGRPCGCALPADPRRRTAAQTRFASCSNRGRRTAMHRALRCRRAVRLRCTGG